MEITSDMRLAFYMALDKKLNDKNGGLLTDAKAAKRQELMELNAAFGADRTAIMVGDQKVGEVGISFAKAKPVIKAERMAEALAYLDDLDMVEIVPKKGWESKFKSIDGGVMCTETGEFVDWAFWEEGYAKSAAVKGCKPEDVLSALEPMLDGASPFSLLEGGE